MDIKPVSSQSPMVGGVTGNVEQAPAVRSGATTSPVAEPTAVDRISLSSAATSTVVNTGTVPFDEKKVDQVRAAIAEGRFPVDAKRIANELIDNASQMLGLPGPGAQRA
jgi:negative regulator of flagellin synthesis FlgM